MKRVTALADGAFKRWGSIPKAGYATSPLTRPTKKEAVFTMKLEPELRDQFMAAAESIHRPASHVLREFMREFIARQGQE